VPRGRGPHALRLGQADRRRERHQAGVRAVTWTDNSTGADAQAVGHAGVLAIMFVVFQSIFYWAKPLMEAVDSVRGSASKSLESQWIRGPLRALLVDGVLRGVGGVLVFLRNSDPLRVHRRAGDCGYMARAAFLMDRLMSKCGLSGKSFIPLLSSVACAIRGSWQPA